MSERLEAARAMLELQGVRTDAQRAATAAALALAVQDRIAAAALAKMAFDDAPTDYIAFQLGQ